MSGPGPADRRGRSEDGGGPGGAGFAPEEVQRLAAGGARVVGPDGKLIGELNQLYSSDETGDLTWATVTTGLFGSQQTFVPLRGARTEGDELRVGVDREATKGAPRVDAGGHLSLDEEAELDRHYGVLGKAGADDRPRRAVAGTTDDQDDPDDRGDPRDQGVGDRAGARDGDRSDAAGDHDRDAVVGRRGISAEDPPQDRDRNAAEDDVRPGERTTRLRRYVVTERVVQSVEELPAEGGTTGDEHQARADRPEETSRRPG